MTAIALSLPFASRGQVRAWRRHMNYIRCATQEELDAVLVRHNPAEQAVCIGFPRRGGTGSIGRASADKR